MQITGKINNIGQTQEVSESFKKREVWIEIDHDTDYPQTIAMELQQDKVDIIEKYSVGQEVEIEFNLRGRIWEPADERPNRCFNTLQIWKLSPVGGAAQPTYEAAPAPQATEESDDLPF